MGVETPKYRVAFTEGPERPRHGRAVRRVHRHRRRGQPRAEQGQGARQHLRPGDAGRARLPAGREALAPRPRGSETRTRGQEDPNRPDPPAAGRQGDARAARRHGAGTRTASTSSSSPSRTTRRRPTRPARSSRPRSRSSRTARSRSSSRRRRRADLLRKAAGIDKGAATASGRPSARSPATSSARSPQTKMPDLNANDVEAARTPDRGHRPQHGHRGRRLGRPGRRTAGERARDHPDPAVDPAQGKAGPTAAERKHATWPARQEVPGSGQAGRPR